MNINVIYEDNHLLVVEKPCNIPSQMDNTCDLDMVNILKDYLKKKYDKKGNVFVGLVHRLDRPVGGIMVFAKTSKAASRLSESIRTNKLKKTYLAVVHGKLDNKSGRLQDYLLKNNKTNMVSVVPKGINGAKEAILEYKVLKELDNLSLVMVQLITGRSHQIRVQFKNNGNPLYGDQKYGQDLNKPGCQIALWSYKLEFPHPTKKDVMKFELKPHSRGIWKVFGIGIEE